jgi:glucosamine-6-phosphate deaminase
MVKESATTGLRLIHHQNATAVGLAAAQLVAEQLQQKPDSSIVFPTGNTPLPMYSALRTLSKVDWGHSRLFQLDEYLSPSQGEPGYETFAAYMQRELWEHVSGQKFYIRDFIEDPEAYERLVSMSQQGAQGPDLVILGIGANGHVAFNEPGSRPDSQTRIIDLTEQTLRSNFGQAHIETSVEKNPPVQDKHRLELPRQAMTLGLRTILSARKILLLATGKNKHAILARALNPVSPPALDCPASWLKTHRNLVVLTDFPVSFPMD